MQTCIWMALILLCIWHPPFGTPQCYVNAAASTCSCLAHTSRNDNSRKRRAYTWQRSRFMCRIQNRQREDPSFPGASQSCFCMTWWTVHRWGTSSKSQESFGSRPWAHFLMVRGMFSCQHNCCHQGAELHNCTESVVHHNGNVPSAGADKTTQCCRWLGWHETDLDSLQCAPGATRCSKGTQRNDL